MSAADGWLRTPVGPDAARWLTMPRRRLVLALARTVTSANRLLDVLPIFEDDPRVQVLFSIVPGSAFDDGVATLLTEAGARTLPWEQAVATDFDLALSASLNGDLHRVRAPLVVLPHGAGLSKLPADGGHNGVASGLTSRQLMRDGRLVPTAIALSAEDDLNRLAASCPQAAPRAVVVGDPCWERILVSQSERSRYRQALGVRDGQRLIVVSSTWGGAALLARRPRLPVELLAELPVDENRVAVALHPNVWHTHGALQVRMWLRRAIAAGLLVLGPREGWRAALVAADWVIGDHGSVTLYAAALGRPVALAAFGAEELAPDGPMAALGPLLPRLPAASGLRSFLEAPPTPTELTRRQRLAGRALPVGPGSLAALGRLLYQRLGLDGPPHPPVVRSAPTPTAAADDAVAAHVVRVELDAKADVVAVSLDRRPAVLEPPADRPGPGGHLVVAEDVDEPRLIESAAVLVRRADDRLDQRAARAWADATLARLPGARIAAVVSNDGRCLAVARGGLAVEVRLGSGEGQGQPDVDPTLLASVAHACVTARAGGDWRPGRLLLRAGGRHAEVRASWHGVSG